jgi:hypothetical protein
MKNGYRPRAKSLWAILLVAGMSGPSVAQKASDFYRLPTRPSSGIGFRVGLNYSTPSVTAAVVKSTMFTTFLGGVEPQFGYYLGGYLYKDLTPDRLTFRLDATIQMKSARAADNGKTVFNASYYYLGITPLIGLRLTDRLTIYTGPEGSLQVAKGKSWGKGYPFELGVNARLTYDFGRFGAELGYFRGFTRIDRFEIGGIPGGPATNDIYNQHVLAGLTYRLSQ